MKPDLNKYLILIQLNEINFDIVQKYIELFPKRFEGFKRLIDGMHSDTLSEEIYEHLEPWIQWVSVHTGKTYNQHKVFRLGDIVNSKEYFDKRVNFRGRRCYTNHICWIYSGRTGNTI